MNCDLCNRELIYRTTWNKLTPTQRANIIHTHARKETTQRCQTCYALWGLDNPAYQGSWERHGLIWRPTHPEATNAA